MDDARELVGAVMWGMLAGLPIALTFAFLGGRALASTAVAPIEQMSAAMAHITAERLSERVPVPTANDEIQRHAKVLNSTLDRLESSYQQALRFSADASHELKTPLTVIRLSVEAILESPNLGEQERIAISSVLEQTRRLTNITASLLLLARADAGRLNLALTQLDLSGLVEACAEDSRIVAEANGITVECNVPERAPAAIDPTRFSQVVSNLLDNAVKYNHPGGTVRVTLQEEATAHGSDWRLTVGNTGPTIPEENQARLFERFFRANPEGDRTGCGLGLGIARELARAHGGDITLVSSRDGWTEFAVFLPKPNAVAVAG
jgi:signal transduction histidine kinase